MSLVNIQGLLPDYDTGVWAGNQAAKIANAAADFACGLYKDFPGAIVGDSSSNIFGRGFMDSLCKDRNLPPAPTPNESAGKCVCEFYRVIWKQTLDDGSTQLVTDEPVPGPISGAKTEGVDGRPEDVQYYYEFGLCEGPELTGTGKRLMTIEYPESPNTQFLGIMGIEKLSGVDNCGGAEHTWNPSLPTVIPEDRKRDTTTIPFNDGTDITIPLIYVPISPEFNLNPEIKVDVGGVTVNFDLGGVTIDFGGETPNIDAPRDRTNDLSDDLDRIDTALRDIRERISDLEDDLEDVKSDKNDTPPPQEDPTVEAEEDEEESESGDREVDKLQYVCIHLTKLPNREQWGAGAPDVYYAGWLEFKVKGCNLPRQPIHFKDSIFKAPEGATGFAYTFTNGAQGRATVYKTKGTQT